MFQLSTKPQNRSSGKGEMFTLNWAVQMKPETCKVEKLWAHKGMGKLSV
jgi:hypothetical protein